MYWYVLVCTGMYQHVLVYTSIYSDFQFTNSVFPRYLIHHDTSKCMKVQGRLSDSFATVVADTSMITMSMEYAAHFHDIYIDGKEHAKMTGDRMKMLMLTLPFMVRDLIAPEVIS